MSIFMAVVFRSICPKKTKNLSFIDLKGNVVNSGKAAKFLAEVSYFYDSFSFQRGRSFVRILFGFLDCSCCWFITCKVLETLQENYKSIKRLR
jgi:hypothetical protein